MLEAAVEPRGFREHGHRGGAAPRIPLDTVETVVRRILQRARRRRAQLDLGHDIEPERRKAQPRRGRCLPGAAPQVRNRHAPRRLGGANGARARHVGEEVAHLAPLAGALAGVTAAPGAENCSSRPSQARARPLSSASAAVRMPAATEALRPAI
jgi:hypothetical protein